MSAVAPWRSVLGERVKGARLAHRWSVRQVSARSHIADTTWRRVETGEQVSDWALTEIAAALGWRPGACFRIMAEALERADREHSV